MASPERRLRCAVEDLSRKGPFIIIPLRESGIMMNGPFLLPAAPLLLPARPARLLRSVCRQLVQAFADLLRGQGAQEFLWRQRAQDFPALLLRQRAQDFPAVFGRQSRERLALLFQCQPREVLLGVLAVEVLHRERHGKSLPL